MKKVFFALTALLCLSATACSDPCAEYSTKAKEKLCAQVEGEAKKTCESTIETVAKAGNKDACKAALEALPK